MFINMFLIQLCQIIIKAADISSATSVTMTNNIKCICKQFRYALTSLGEESITSYFITVVAGLLYSQLATALAAGNTSR